MNQNTLKKKFVIIFLIIAMLVPYVPVFTTDVKAVTTSQTFNYTGGVQEFIVPNDGIYKLEVWGASGADDVRGSYPNIPLQKGGLGGYSKKYVYLTKGTKLYICVGGAGHEYYIERNTDFNFGLENYFVYGGYNGGGSSCKNSSGGGATHIAINTNRGELYNYEQNKEEILVVAGGGGAGGRSVTMIEDGGVGGGEIGGGWRGELDPLRGGTQTEPGKNRHWTYNEEYNEGGYWTEYSLLDGEFGRGSILAFRYNWHEDMDKEIGVDGIWNTFLHGWTGAGGGWYGGAGGYNYNGCIGAGGGSGYIGEPIFIYDGVTYNNTTVAGQNKGNGQVIITLEKSAAYTLTINPNGGSYSGNTSVEIAPGATANIPNPTRAGFTFTGWTITPNNVGSSLNGTTFTMGNANTTLTANWTKNNYNLNVNPNGGIWNGSTSAQNFTIAYQETKSIGNPSLTGFTFTGWSLAGAGSSLNGTTFTIGYDNAYLTANWSRNNYNLNVNPNGRNLEW